MKRKIKKFTRRLGRLPLHTKIIGIIVIVFLSGYGLIFGFSKSVEYSYTGQDCARQLTFFPSVMYQSGPSDFNVRFEDVHGLGNIPLVSFKTCFEAMKPPTPGTSIVSVSPYGSWFANKKFALKITSAPVAQTTDFIGKTLPVTRPVEIKLTGVDEVFSYKFKVGDKTTGCNHTDSKLHCDIEALNLTQGETYDASLIRYFDNQQIGVLGKGEIKTLKAIALVNSTVMNGQTVYTKPTQFSFEYDKPLQAVEAELKTRDGGTIESTVKIEGKSANIIPKTELQRDAQFDITLKKVEAIDGSALADPYVVGFTMSDGPKVSDVSAGSTGVALGGTITVTFDQEVANFDVISKLVAISGLAAQVSGNKTQLTIKYNADLCADFSIVIKKGLESAAGIVQNDDWSFTGRTLCYTVRTFGYSKQGRAMNAYTFGSGNKTVLYTGTIHGNEQSAKSLMNAWINELDYNARAIPTGTRIVVVPAVNPDGVAANSRYNAAGIDLNRNYDVSDWRSDVETVNGDPLPGGGGPAPGSEPETQAMMALTFELRPRLTMSFHSSASYAIANTCGDSSGLANTYARMTGYSDMTGVSGAFGYQISGTYDDWICERLGLASVLIELASSTNAEFGRNKAALWATARS